jgi:hypothetical protein
MLNHVAYFPTCFFFFFELSPFLFFLCRTHVPLMYIKSTFAGFSSNDNGFSKRPFIVLGVLVATNSDIPLQVTSS